jgi:peptidoglycan DL-endopeptidase CwlO
MVKSKLMKQRSTTPVSSKSLATKGTLVAAAILMAAAAPISMFVKPVEARDFASEIQAVQNQINQYQAEAGRLASQARTLENELARLNNEKAALQAQIDLNQAKYDKLIEEIAQKEAEIVKTQDNLGTILADMYVDDEVSPVERIASSNNLGDYLDKQTYRAAISDQLNEAIEKIKLLKQQLEQAKVDVQRVLDDQKAQREALAAKEAEQQALVNETRGQEAAYQALSAKSEATKKDLERQQQAAIAAAMRAAGNSGSAVAGDPSKGGYPAYLANAAQDTIVDDWLLYNRECVSYTAWKVYQKNGYMPKGYGNANMWPGNARAGKGYNGVPVTTSSVPRAGSVGVISAGAYGHVVWVESVNANGTINISQYNELTSAGWGHYSERYNVNPSTYDTYIYF